MKILVNGAWHETASSNVAAVLRELNYGDSLVATAVNGIFVPVAARVGTPLGEGDRLEVVAPMQGG